MTALLTRAAKVRREFASGSSNSSMSSDTNLVGRRRGSLFESLSRDRLSSRSSTIDHSPMTFKSEYAKRKEEFGDRESESRPSSLTRSQTDRMFRSEDKGSNNSRKSSSGDRRVDNRRTLDMIDGQSHAVTPSSSLTSSSKATKPINNLASYSRSQETSHSKGLENIKSPSICPSSQFSVPSRSVLPASHCDPTVDVTSLPVNSISHYEGLLEKDSAILSAPSTINAFKVTPISLETKLPPMKYKRPRSTSLQRNPIDDTREVKSTATTPSRNNSLPSKPPDMSLIPGQLHDDKCPWKRFFAEF